MKTSRVVRGSQVRTMTTTRSLVSVVDDDESVRESLPDLLREFGFSVRAFSSAEEFLASDCVDQTECLVLDITMPGMTGPELQQELKNLEKNIPIIFITAQRDEAVRARVLEQGAIACLFKPFSDTDLGDSVNAALERETNNNDEKASGRMTNGKMRKHLWSLFVAASLFRPTVRLWHSFLWDL
jgi:FixJ family two-component response regulator